MRVAVATTHPIQYQVPWLRMLSAREDVDLHVYFAMVPDASEQGREFGVSFEWDTPLLEGYAYSVLENTAPVPSLTSFSGCDTPSIVGAIRSGGYDAVVVNGWGTKMALQALWACRRYGIPCVVRGEANGLRERGILKRLAHRLLFRQYAAFLAIGRQNRVYYESLGVWSARMFDTPYCVDNEKFARDAAQVRAHHTQADLRTTFGLAPNAPTFVFSGKFVEKKHPLDAVHALRRLCESGVDAQLLMVGDGPLRGTLESAAQGLPVAFPGFLNQSRIATAYAAADCLVLPSDAGETWGLVVNEAMACGLPAIVSDQVGCAVDLVRRGETGDVFACRNIAEMASQMAACANASDRWASRGNSASALVTQTHSFERVVEGALAALRAVLS